MISNFAVNTSKILPFLTQMYLYDYSACHKPWEIFLGRLSCQKFDW
jgi:hypothetical protein